MDNTIRYSVYEDDCLYGSYITLAEAQQTAAFILDNIGQPTSVYKEQYTTSGNIILSTKIS